MYSACGHETHVTNVRDHRLGVPTMFIVVPGERYGFVNSRLTTADASSSISRTSHPRLRMESRINDFAEIHIRHPRTCIRIIELITCVDIFVQQRFESTINFSRATRKAFLARRPISSNFSDASRTINSAATSYRSSYPCVPRSIVADGEMVPECAKRTSRRRLERSIANCIDVRRDNDRVPSKRNLSLHSVPRLRLFSIRKSIMAGSISSEMDAGSHRKARDE